MPWLATTHERRSLMYSYSPKHMATHDNDGTFYEHRPAPWLVELTPVQRAVLEPPYAAGVGEKSRVLSVNLV